jgi:hypothetical protein
MTADQKEELRRGVRGWLADRSALAFNVGTIQRGVSRSIPCTEPEVEAACVLLLDLGHLKEVPNTLGANRYFQIHAAGSLAHERGE